MPGRAVDRLNSRSRLPTGADPEAGGTHRRQGRTRPRSGLYEGFVRIDDQGRTFLVDPLKNGGQKHTFLFKYADGKILLDDDKSEQTQAETSEAAAEQSGTAAQAPVADEAVEFPSISLDEDGPEVPWVM